MMLRNWEDIPEFMRCDEVRTYYEVLNRKRFQLCEKRVLDVCLALVLLLILMIPMLVISLMIKLDSPGNVLFRQERVTAYGKRFRIHKFRTMVDHADRKGTAVTVQGDARVTKVGSMLRNKRLDELPQLLDILAGDMTFVGTRAEVPKYVSKYSKEMLATLLLPAGVTSEASIRFKDEAEMLANAEDADTVYVEKVLPQKMKINLKSLRHFSIGSDFATLIRTVFAV